MRLCQCLVFVFTLFSISSCSQAGIETILVHNNGKTLSYSSQNELQPFFKQISNLLGSVEGVLKTIISPSEIEYAIQTSKGIEIIYLDNQVISFPFSQYPFFFTKLYVSLSGRLSKPEVVLFFGDDGGYGSVPPYITKIRIDEVVNLKRYFK